MNKQKKIKRKRIEKMKSGYKKRRRENLKPHEKLNLV
jgi:hypothetical protein